MASKILLIAICLLIACSCAKNITNKELHEGCGWRNDESKFGESPWGVALIYSYDIRNVHFGGGSLIAPNVVLTSAAIMKDSYLIDKITVRDGKWDPRNDNELLSHVNKSIKEIIIHEGYDIYYRGNDIALLILKEPFDLQEHIGPICLPDQDANFDSSRCYVTGWYDYNDGYNNDNDNDYDNDYEKKQFWPSFRRDICKEYLTNQPIFVQDSSFCAGGEKGKNICKGSIGSPLVCPISGDKNRYYQAGILSLTAECRREYESGVFTKVSHMRSWISEKLTARDIIIDSHIHEEALIVA